MPYIQEAQTICIWLTSHRTRSHSDECAPNMQSHARLFIVATCRCVRISTSPHMEARSGAEDVVEMYALRNTSKEPSRFLEDHFDVEDVVKL